MTALIVREAAIGDLAWLAKLPALTTLELYPGRWVPLPDVKGLAHAPKLKVLKIYKEGPLDLAPVAALKELEDLTLNGPDAAALPPLASKDRLRRLELTSTDITSIEGLRGAAAPKFFRICIPTA